MESQGWDALLPRLFSEAGIDARDGFEVTPMTGGVSSDIVYIRLGDGREFAAKRALPQLKVATEWKAPLERNHYEVAWLKRAGGIVPGIAPAVLAEDRTHGIALLEYLRPEDYRLWKTELLAGRADPPVAGAVANALGRIHAATLNDAAAAAEFRTDAMFDALRLDPYLRFTASRHPNLAPSILAVLEATAGTRLALVHGDVSPKNILVSKRDGHPVLLDAECAWFGDPAFDAAFCLNHLVLKSVHLPAIRHELLFQAHAFAAEWIRHFPNELQPGLLGRVGALLPCLMLARVDGKSPVEYLGEESRRRVRDLAIPLITAAKSLDGVLAGAGG
jgi:aminoglycoside phosphotransferase (APT) family kinase protein